MDSLVNWFVSTNVIKELDLIDPRSSVQNPKKKKKRPTRKNMFADHLSQVYDYVSIFVSLQITSQKYIIIIISAQCLTEIKYSK